MQQRLTSKRERNSGNGNDVGNCQKSGKPFSCIGNVFAVDSSLSMGDPASAPSNIGKLWNGVWVNIDSN
jgi:hypothetical protein